MSCKSMETWRRYLLSMSLFFAFGIVTDGQLFSLVAKGGINAPRMRDFYLHSLVADQRNPEDKLFTNHLAKV